MSGSATVKMGGMIMSKPALIALWIGVLLIVALGLFPPWIGLQSWEISGGTPHRVGYTVFGEIGHRFLLTSTWDSSSSCRIIDLTRLIAQWGVVGSLTLA